MPESIVVLQARTNSSRLPGKVLLPLAGMPLVVLAARRAANTNRAVMVATSEEPSDDQLARILEKEGIPCFRGSLNNTLKRFVDALSDYPDDTLVFRLTGDNVFPDGSLLDEMEAHYLLRDSRYLCCGGEESGLPYGVSAELVRLSELRLANAEAHSVFDQEHVTPIIRRKYNEHCFDRYRYLGRSHFRATVDCLDDYFAVKRVFDGVHDPLSIPFLDLVVRLEGAPFQPFVSRPAKKFVLGTAQLGMKYGIASKDDVPSLSLASLIIKKAICNGVSYLDTARAYGLSESVVGESLAQGWQGRVNVVTKLPPFVSCPDDAGPETVKNYVEANVYKSCTALGVKALDTLLLHREEYRYKWGGVVWRHLKLLKEQGLIGKLGVSVQTPSEMAACLDDPAVEHLQLPFNILDYRWEELIPKVVAEKESRDLVVHVRSALLQGILPCRDPLLWNKIGFDDAENIINWLESEREKSGVSSIAALCLLYCFSQAWVDGVVTGVESEEQLLENLFVFSQSPFSQQDLQDIYLRQPLVQSNLLDPSSWMLEKSHG